MEFVFNIYVCNKGHRKENQEKNRNPLIVPPDERRPYLTSFISHFNSTTNSDAGMISTSICSSFSYFDYYSM